MRFQVDSRLDDSHRDYNIYRVMSLPARCICRCITGGTLTLVSDILASYFHTVRRLTHVHREVHVTLPLKAYPSRGNTVSGRYVRNSATLIASGRRRSVVTYCTLHSLASQTYIGAF